MEKKTYRILIADDEELIRALVKDQIEFINLPENIELSIFEAADGEEAYDQLIQSQYDLLITDLGMPKLEGNDLIAKLTLNRDLFPKHIIVISGYINVTEEERHIDNVYFYSKPLPDEMQETIERLINGGE